MRHHMCPRGRKGARTVLPIGASLQSSEIFAWPQTRKPAPISRQAWRQALLLFRRGLLLLVVLFFPLLLRRYPHLKPTSDTAHFSQRRGESVQKSVHVGRVLSCKKKADLKYANQLLRSTRPDTPRLPLARLQSASSVANCSEADSPFFFPERWREHPVRQRHKRDRRLAGLNGFPGPRTILVPVASAVPARSFRRVLHVLAACGPPGTLYSRCWSRSRSGLRVHAVASRGGYRRTPRRAPAAPLCPLLTPCRVRRGYEPGGGLAA